VNPSGPPKDSIFDRCIRSTVALAASLVSRDAWQQYQSNVAKGDLDNLAAEQHVETTEPTFYNVDREN